MLLLNASECAIAVLPGYVTRTKFEIMTQQIANDSMPCQCTAFFIPEVKPKQNGSPGALFSTVVPSHHALSLSLLHMSALASEKLGRQSVLA